MSICFLDTSAVLNGGLTEYHDNELYISPLTLQELQNIKTSDRNENIKFLAREAIRAILNSHIHVPALSVRKVLKKIHKYDFLQEINDHKIICEALLIEEQLGEKITFITSDSAQFLFAQQCGLISPILFERSSSDAQEWNGWNKYSPTAEEFTLLYSNLKINTLHCHTNEFAEIYENNELKDILFWNGEEYRKLNYKEFTSTLGERIKPRNLEQKLYLDLLQNKDIPVKLCIAKFGTGKSFLALNYALKELQSGRFEKIIFIKNNLEVKGAGTLGTLPGDQIDKQMPWLMQIADHVGAEAFNELLNEGKIEPTHLSSLRGRDLKNCIILVDEAENLLDTNIQLILGRVAENSEVIFCADIKQCDYKNIHMSGIPKLIARLKGNKLFGMVKLLKTERSEVAALADLLD